VTAREYTLAADGTLVRIPSAARVVVKPLGPDMHGVLVFASAAPPVDPASIDRLLAGVGAPQAERICTVPAPEPLPFGADGSPSILDQVLEAAKIIRERQVLRPEPIVLPKRLFDVYARAFADATGTDWERHAAGLSALAARAVSDSTRAHDERPTQAVRAHDAHDRAHDDAHLRAQAAPSMPLPARTPRLDRLTHGVPVRADDPMAVLVVNDPHPAGPPPLVDRPDTHRVGVRFVGGPLHGRTGHTKVREWEDGELRPLLRFDVPTMPRLFFVGLERYVRTRLLACGAWAYEWRPLERAQSRPALHRRDVPDELVIEHAARRRAGGAPGVVTALMREGVPHNLAYAKVMHLVERGHLDYGTSPYGAWPTGKHLERTPLYARWLTASEAAR